MKKNGVVSNLFWAFGERISAQLVSLIVSIVLARLLSPDDYAVVAIVMILITIANAFVTGGFGNSLIQKKEADDDDFSSVFYLSLLLSVVFYFFLFFLSPFVEKTYNIPNLSFIIRIMSLRIVIASVNSIQHAYVARRMEFRKFFFSTLGGTIISGIIGVWMAVRGFGVWALVAQYLSNVTIDTIVLTFTCGWRPKICFSLKRVKSLFSYGWKLLVVEVLYTIYSELKGIILSKWFPKVELSYYNQGKKYPQLFNDNIESATGKVLFSQLSSEQNDICKVKEITRTTISWMSFILFPIYFGLMACSKSLISILLTEKWLPSVPYLNISCLVFIVSPLLTANTRVMKAIGEAGSFLMFTIMRYGIGTFLLIVTLLYSKSPYLVVLSELFATMIMWISCASFNEKKIFYSLGEQILDILPPFLCSLIMYLMVRLVDHLSVIPIIKLIIQISIGIAAYLVLSYLLNRRSYNLIISKMRDRKSN